MRRLRVLSTAVHGSSLFSLCPSCRVRANIQRAQASLRCLSCNFDFASLAHDPAALERWMGDNLRDGSLEMTVTLSQLILQIPEPEARARVTAFAAQHGIAAPKGGNAMLYVVIGGALFLFALLGCGLASFFVTR